MVTPRARAFLKLAAILLSALACGIVVWRAGGLQQITPQAVLPHLLTLDGWVAVHPFVAGWIFLALGSVLIASSLPGVALTVMTAAGFVFGPLMGGSLALAALLLGSTLAFTIARCLSRPIAATALGPVLQALADRLNSGHVTTLIVARVAPGAPFWIVNLALGVMRLDPIRFLWTSAVGFAPGAAIFSMMGDGLGHQMRTTGRMDASVLTSPRVWGPFLVLTVMVLVFGVWARWRARVCD